MSIKVGTFQGRIVSRRPGRTSHEKEYSVLLGDATTTLVRERHEADKFINDLYEVNVYQDKSLNTFGKKL